MGRIIGLMLALLPLTVAATSQAQAPIQPAVVYSVGGKQDTSINESVSRGVMRFWRASQVEVAEVEPKEVSEFEPALRRLARAGFQPIVAVGSLQGPAVSKVALDFPETSFALLDGELFMPNVRSITFKEHQATFLLGMLATMASKTAKVGFVGGMDVPLIRRYQCGYAQGIRFVNPRVELIASMTGTTSAAWSDPARGAELARAQFARGADVIYAAAGGTGMGVVRAAKENGKLAIGDAEQYRLFPGTMLSALIKHFDDATYETLAIATRGRWKGGRTQLGLDQNAIGWAHDENNKALVSREMKARIDDAHERINEGKIAVHDYMADNSCPL